MAVVIRKLHDFKINNDSLVKLKEMGNVSEIMYSVRKNTFCPIRMIDKDHYVKIDFATGEVSDIYDCNHIENRGQSLFQVSQSIKRLRDLINTNVVDTTTWKWVTLTYKENMTDSTRLYRDFQKFMQRLRYKYNQYKIEYIIACEPQARGAWHIHALINFNEVIPFIPNYEIESLWGNGFTKTKKLADIDNIGAYLSAYLGDVELTKDNLADLKKQGYKLSQNVSGDVVKEIEIDGKKKRYIKGARLYMYPPNFNMYRFSRGMKKPKVYQMQYFDAKIKVGYSNKPTYTKSIYLEDIENKYNNTISYEYYNTRRPSGK